MQTQSRYPDWQAPKEDSGVLIWPEPHKLLEDTRENHRRLSSADALVGGIAIKELRHELRAWLKLPEDRPVIATGHQTELYHTGVWAKLALINAAADRLGGEAIHLAVDSDSPKHLHLRWPGASWPITDDPQLLSVEWSGLLNRPTPKYISDLRTALHAAAGSWPFKPMAFEFLDLLAAQTNRPLLSGAIVEAQHQFDEKLGLKHRAMLASPIWMSPGYLAMAHHLMSRATEFARIYNAALGEYRIAHRLRTVARPMPDLQISSNQCESPFWLDNLSTRSRDRAVIQCRGKDCVLLLAGESFVLKPGISGGTELQKFLQARNVRLSPRALTLTLFMRLLVVDQFVHGIGGGRYDQVTNTVIQKFFGLTPPEFAVSTATIYFPTAVGRDRVCLPCLAQEGHRLRHSLLNGEKKQIVDQINTLPRRSIQRQQLYSQMHDKLATALLNDPRVKSWQKRVEDGNQRHLEEQSLFDRELFYAIQPRDRLNSVIAAYQQRF